MSKHGNACGAAKDELEKCAGALRRAGGRSVREEMQTELSNSDDFAHLLYSAIATYAMVCLLRNGAIRNASSTKLRNSLHSIRLGPQRAAAGAAGRVHVLAAQDLARGKRSINQRPINDRSAQ